MGKRRKLGIVLSGGGAKGAYQIGVWKYLHEIGLDEYICCYSGASVGALNAVLMAASDVETAEKIWVKDNIKNKILHFNKVAFLKGVLKNLPKFRQNPLIWTINQAYKIYNKGLFSREGLKEIISKIDLSKINLKSNSVFVAITKANLKDVQYPELNKMAESDIEDALLASSALPIVYPIENVNEERYRDGGIKDNIPIKPIKEKKVSDIIVVYLDNDKTQDRIPDAKNIHKIFPTTSLATGKRPVFIPESVYKFIFGTLDFTQEHLRNKRYQGYYDCCTQYSEMLNELLKKYKESD